MYKIDSHQHFWDLQQLTYPWMSPDQKVLYRDYTPADLAPVLAEMGVAGTVVVQATHAVRETEWFLSLAQQAGFIRGVVGWVDLTAPDVGDQVDRLRAMGPLVGIRHQVHEEADNEWIVREPVLQGLNTLAARDMPYDLLVRPPHLPVLPRLFDAVPGMTWIVDHLAKPYIARGELQPWQDDLARVAQYPNVVCKVSGMTTEAGAAWTVDDIRPYFDAVLAMFGPSRLMFGSDWPVCLLAGSYQQVHDLVVELVRELSPDEQSAIWSGTARRVYGF
jgi:L-fuconolactonase